MSNPFEPLVSNSEVPGAEVLRPDSADESQPMFARPQDPPKPSSNPMAARAQMMGALRDGDPNGDNLPREDGAPTRD